MSSFDTGNFVIEDARALCGRTELVEELRRKVRETKDVLLLGPEGVGKSSLLACAFSMEFRREMAERGLLITPRFEYPVSLAGDRVFPYLVDRILSAMNALNDEKQLALRAEIQESRQYQMEPSGMFADVIDRLHDAGYRIMLVIDNFERFTLSPHVTLEHHETLRALMDQSGLRFAMATNFDFTRDSLPDFTRGSYLLQRFRGSEMPVRGWDLKVCREFLQQCGGESFSMYADRLHKLTGGVPALMRLAGREVAMALEQNDDAPLTDDQWGYTLLHISESAASTLKHWCEMINEVQMKTCRDVLSRHGVVQDTGVAEQLCIRDLLRRGRRGGGTYEYTSQLLADYIAALIGERPVIKPPEKPDGSSPGDLINVLL